MTHRKKTRAQPDDRSQLHLICDYVALESLTPNPHNARVHSKAQIQRIADSIKEHGWVFPVVVNAAGLIIAGNGRWQAGKLLGLQTCPVIRLEHLSADECTALALVDNKLVEEATWNEPEVDRQLQALTLKFDIPKISALTGFAVQEVDFRIERIGNAAARDRDDEFDALPDGDPVTRLGDLWLLGDHRVLCGDALARASYEMLMGPDRAHMVFTDAPYNVKIRNVAGRGRRRFREFAQASGEKSRDAFTDFLSTALRLMGAHCTGGALLYSCMDWRHQGEICAAVDNVFGQLLNVAIWVKPSGGMGSLYRSAYELIFITKNGSAPHCNNVQLGKFGRTRTNVWTYDRPVRFGQSSADDRFAGEHPTPKPVALVADAIMDATDRGQIVLDGFLGAGSSLIAAERVGRRCRGIEIDPRYVDLTIRRFEHVTGKQARLGNGKTFAEVARQRGIELSPSLKNNKRR